VLRTGGDVDRRRDGVRMIGDGSGIICYDKEMV